MPPHPSLRLAYGGLRLLVSADEADLAWLDEFVRPWFNEERADDSAPDVTVIASTDAPLVTRQLEVAVADASSSLADVFVLDSRVVRHPAWRDDRDRLRIADSELRVLYVVGRREREIEILSSGDRTGARVALMRVVRELAMAHVADGGLLLHAAAVEAGGRALVVAGPKRAGKTTLLLHVLQARGVSFIANDRVLVEAAAAGPRIIGLPSIVSLRDGTLALFPAFHANAIAAGHHFSRTIDGHRAAPARPSSRPIDLTPAQLCGVAGVARVASAPPAALLFPDQTWDRSGVASPIARLSPRAAARRLRDCVFGGGAFGPGTGVFAWSGEAEGRGTALREALARSVPAFVCRVAPADLPNADRAQALVDELTRPRPTRPGTPSTRRRRPRSA